MKYSCKMCNKEFGDEIQRDLHEAYEHDQLEWRVVPDVGNQLEANQLGELKWVVAKGNRPANYVMTGYRSKRGYLQVMVDGRREFVHRLVAKAFLDNPQNKPQINHINGCKTDNRVCNLEWVTALENVQHAIVTRLADPKGENNEMSKLTDDCVKAIRTLYELGVNQPTLAKGFDVTQSLISLVVLRKVWKHVA